MKKMKTRTKILLLGIINVIWFAIAVLILSALDKTVPDSLIVAWFSAWTVEFGLLAGITIKGKAGDDE